MATERIIVEPKRAYVYRREGSSVWQAHIKLKGHGRKRVSTGCVSVEEAKQWTKDHLLDAMSRNRNGQPIWPKTFKEAYLEYLSDFKKEVVSEDKSLLLLEKLENCYTNYLSRYFDDMDLVSIQEDTIKSFRHTRMEWGISGARPNAKDTKPKANTVKKELNILRQILSWTYRKGYITRIPEIPMLKESPGREDFKEHEWKKLLAWFDMEIRKHSKQKGNTAADRQQLKTLVQLIGYGGVRAGRETSNLTWRNIQVVTKDGSKFQIDTEKGNSYIADYKSKDPKSIDYVLIRVLYPKPKTPVRWVSALAFAEPALRAWRSKTDFPEIDDWVFCHQKSSTSGEPGERITSFKKQFRGALEATALLQVEGKPNRSLTSCRHTYATLRLEEPNLEIYELAKNMGTSVELLERTYGHYKPERFASRLASVSER